MATRWIVLLLMVSTKIGFTFDSSSVVDPYDLDGSGLVSAFPDDEARPCTVCRIQRGNVDARTRQRTLDDARFVAVAADGGCPSPGQNFQYWADPTHLAGNRLLILSEFMEEGFTCRFQLPMEIQYPRQ